MFSYVIKNTYAHINTQGIKKNKQLIIILNVLNFPGRLDKKIII